MAKNANLFVQKENMAKIVRKIVLVQKTHFAILNMENAYVIKGGKVISVINEFALMVFLEKSVTKYVNVFLIILFHVIHGLDCVHV